MTREELPPTDVFEAIHAAQEGYLAYYPTYQVALSEIRRGAKQSCWMWYVWPSLRAVRRHRMPGLLLPDLKSAVDYLQHSVLGVRLMEITKEAVWQLDSGRSTPKRLMCGGLDSTKLHETCTVFAIAAAACDNYEAMELFGGLVHRHYGGLLESVLEVLREDESELEYGGDVDEWTERVQTLVRRMTDQPSPRCRSVRVQSL